MKFRAVAALACIVACGVDRAPSVAVGRVGASIAVAGASVAVVNPDQGSVSLVDGATLAQTAVVSVGEEPRALLVLSSGRILVTTQRSGTIVAIDQGAVTATQSICTGPYGLAESPDASYVAVACEWDGTVVRVDPVTLAAHTIAKGLVRPRAVAVAGTDVIVTEFVSGNLERIAADGTVTPISLVPSNAPYRPALTKMTANQAAAIAPAFGRLFVAHELVNNTGESSLEKIADDYGSVTDGNPKINPAITAVSLDQGAAPSLANDVPALYAKYDGGLRVFNGPVAIASLGDHELLVADVSTNDVVVLDANASDPDAHAIASFAVGAGPAGIAVDAAKNVAYVDNAFDYSISRIDLAKTSTFAVAPDATQVRDLPKPYSALAQEGRKLFFDASNTHVTPSGVVACSTCHPGGADDGLVWFIHTSKIPLKRRRTPHLANSHTATAPFHWDGSFAKMSDLVLSTITDLMAGDAILVDLDSVQAYVDEMVRAPVAPPGDPASIARGAAIFAGAGACATCHAGPDFTDDQLHVVLDPMSLTSDDAFPRADTPALHGLFTRPPYWHDGRSATLADLLTRPDATMHGKTQGLAASDVADLASYLESL